MTYCFLCHVVCVYHAGNVIYDEVYVTFSLGMSLVVINHRHAYLYVYVIFMFHKNMLFNVYKDKIFSYIKKSGF